MANLQDSGDDEMSRDGMDKSIDVSEYKTRDSDVKEMPAKKYKPEKLENTEELARQLLGDL